MEEQNLNSEDLHPKPRILMKGLNNLGNTCYMNSSLQALYAIRELREHLLLYKEIPKPLHQSMGELFSQMNRQNNRQNNTIKNSLSPTQFWNTFTEFKPEFRDKHQHDAQECLRFIIDGVHEEVNRAKQRRTKRKTKRIINTSHKAWKEFIRVRDDSVFVHIFVGQFKSTIECTHCHNKSVSWEQFWDISLPLIEEEDIDVNKCFESYIADEILDSDSMPECSQCKQNRKSLKTMTIEIMPLILIIHLKRFGNDGQKIETDIRVNELLTIKDCKYYLFACISHRGSSCSGGHYVAHCKHVDKWFLFDDESVSHEKKMDFSHLKNAYILFYHNSQRTVDVSNFHYSNI